MSPGRVAVLLAIDIVVVAGLSVLVGATAPRWPVRWLQRDVGPLRLTGLDTPSAYRRTGVSGWSARLPELGAAFGGASKSTRPERTAPAMRAYLVEIRRAEWVHLVSSLTWVPLAFFNPWWLTLAFAVVVVLVNVPFLLILRHNRMRVTRLLNRLEPAGAGGTDG